MRDERIAAVVQGIPGCGGDACESLVYANVRQAPLSRKRSASSAAMQPKPAEVIAWR